MSETIIIVPVNNDTRPTSFSYSFLRDGVKIDMTINTREEAIAKATRDDVLKLDGWTQTPTNDEITMGQIPLYVAGGLFAFGAFLFFGLFVLMMAGWLPVLDSDSIYGSDRMDTVFYIMKMYLRVALVAYIPLSGFFMFLKWMGDRPNAPRNDGIDDSRSLHRPLPK